MSAPGVVVPDASHPSGDQRQAAEHADGLATADLAAGLIRVPRTTGGPLRARLAR